VVNRLVATADDAGPPGRDEEYGFGRLDIVKALTADVPHVDRNPLGYPDATPSTAAAAPSHDSFRLSGTTIALLVGLAVLALLVLVALVVVMLVVLRRRSGPRGGVAVPPGGTPYR